MIVDREITIDASADEVYTHVVDIPFVGSCLPGAENVTVDPDDPSNYRGRVAVKVGPIAVGLQGNVKITESDDQTRHAVLMLRASDRRIGGDVVGEMKLAVTEKGASQSVLVVHTDVTVSGKLGQFGQAVMIKKADQITEKFVKEFSRKLLAKDGAPAPTEAAAPARAAAPAPVPSASPAVVAAPPAVTTAPLRTGDPYALAGLLGGTRRVWLDRGDLGPTSLPVWQVGSAGSRSTGRRIVEVAVADEAELSAALNAISDRSAAVALSPQGDAVGDPGALAGLLKAATAAGRVALPVARTPWTALAVARVASSEGAPGLAIVLDTPAEVGAMLALTIAEIRAADLHLPIVAGVVRDTQTADELLEAGADGVLLSQGRRRTRVTAVVNRLRRKS